MWVYFCDTNITTSINELHLQWHDETYTVVTQWKKGLLCSQCVLTMSNKTYTHKILWYIWAEFFRIIPFPSLFLTFVTTRSLHSRKIQCQIYMAVFLTPPCYWGLGINNACLCYHPMNTSFQNVDKMINGPYLQKMILI